MSLDRYKKKRDFARSPEPAGDATLAARRAREKAGRTPRFFCVQKHLASQLHYDFRLEHDGVLLSWAVPKGPSLDSSVKRLAMHVEDHPIEYGEFEGVIPSGYGAGIVMLWDRGTWTPETDDVPAAMAKGDLKFTLDGYKLKGSWVLVRTRGWGGGGSSSAESWLLIKHKDQWSGAIDIAEFAPLSVKTELDFAGILAQDDPDVWRSNRPAETGDTGRMFKRIIEQALAMRSGAATGAGKTAAKPTARKSAATAADRTTAERPGARTAAATRSRRTAATPAARTTVTKSPRKTGAASKETRRRK